MKRDFRKIRGWDALDGCPLIMRYTPSTKFHKEMRIEIKFTLVYLVSMNYKLSYPEIRLFNKCIHLIVDMSKSTCCGALASDILD